jgi:ethanolamine ammonia-lyase small subunit
MDEARINDIIEAVVREMLAGRAAPGRRDATGVPSPAGTTGGGSQLPASAPSPTGAAGPTSQATQHTSRSAPVPDGADLTIDLPDPTLPEQRSVARVKHASDPEALQALMASTSARIGVGRAGPRYSTASLLLFQADHAVTQDALYRDVDAQLLDELGLFSVQTRVTGGKQEYLLRPDLGRQLSDEARREISERCVAAPNLQVVVGDGLSAAAVEANVREMLPILRKGARAAGLSMGTPFFVKYCRVGVLNDIGDILKPDVVILLLGERPGLGRAESLSAYMAYRPKAGDTDAERDVICNIFNNGGTNPLEAAAFALQTAQLMMRKGASGIRLKQDAGN